MVDANRPARTGSLASVPEAWLAVLVVAVAILVASVVPDPTTGGSPTGPFGLVGADAWLHAVGYGALALVLVRALASGGRSALGVCAVAVVATVAYGLAMELLQVPLPTRSFEVGDLVADGVGAALAVVLWWFSRARRGRSGRGRL